MSSSLREAGLDDTLQAAKRVAKLVGITRVTDTTWLDKIGIPVFASVRPDATRESLCVNAGKGLRPKEAQVGAYMEAIEFASAEYGQRCVEVISSTPRKLVQQQGQRFRFADYCVVWGRNVAVDDPIACVEAEDISTGVRLLVPAELVFSPFLENPSQSLFGTSTNGLCSGNTVDEATVHGLSELIERDIQAHDYLRDGSRWVDFDTMPETIAPLVERVGAAGLDLAVRYSDGGFRVPYFHAYVVEPTDYAPIAIAHGCGAHPFKEIAAVRAITEAAQSRLSYIHGGRDDLIERFNYFSDRPSSVELEATASERQRIFSRDKTVLFSDIQDGAAEVRGVPAALDYLLKRLAERNIFQVLRVVLSPPGRELPVVRVIAPKLESFQPTLKRFGPRLRKLLDA